LPREVRRTTSVDVIHNYSQPVGNYDLQEEAEDHELHAADKIIPGEMVFALKLRQKPNCPLNGTGDELREKCDEKGKDSDMPHRLHLAKIHVKSVTQALERVERDPHRKDDIHQREAVCQPRKLEKRVRRPGEEVGVFEIEQDTQIGGQANA